MSPVPVMTFHSVGDAALPYDMRHLTTTPGVLERVLKWLNRHGFQTLTHQELFDHLSKGKSVPEKSLLLTFDDGYLDNWVYVHPLLAKYGHCGTIYVTGQFVDPGTELRPTMLDSWDGEIARGDLPGRGYCNWAELRAMSEAGTLEVQSHLMTHSWQATSDKVVGFHRPDQPWYWEAWNRNIDAKPFWLDWSRKELDQRIPWGAPVYESVRTHTSPRCTPDPRLEEHLAEKLRKATVENGDAQTQSFFEQADWEQQLTQWANDFQCQPPQMESREDFEKRFSWECSESRRLIEKHIPSQAANFMAWPGGDYDARLQELALEHFDATFTTDHGVTLPGEDATLIKRSFFAQRSPELTGWDYPSYLHFVGRLQRLRGHSIYKLHTFISNRVIQVAARRKK